MKRFYKVLITYHIFNAEPEGETAIDCDEKIVGTVKKHLPLFPAIIAFIGALIQVPYGFVSSLWAEFFVDLFGMNASRFALAVILIHAVAAVITITLAVIALVITAKQTECRTNRITRILSIVALALCGLALIINILCVVFFIF